MTYKGNELLYLQDILDAIKKINEFMGKLSFVEFIKDEKTQYAVIRALEIIGEASKKIDQELKENYKEIPWREMSGLRDKLIYDYFGVNTEVIWKTVTEDIPILNKKLKEIFNHLR
jgi:uncharacterized protein with HEPN domain